MIFYQFLIIINYLQNVFDVNASKIYFKTIGHTIWIRIFSEFQLIHYIHTFHTFIIIWKSEMLI